MNYSQPAQPRKDLEYVDKIKMLREHKSRLSNLGSANADVVDIGYFQPGFPLGDSPELLMFAHGNRLLLSKHSLDFLQLASRNRGTTSNFWTLENLGVEFVYAIADLESDLLALFESLSDDNLVKVHLRSARSGRVHSAALHPVILSEIRPSERVMVYTDAQITGTVLAMTKQFVDGVTYLVIWDWTSGVQLKVSEAQVPLSKRKC